MSHAQPLRFEPHPKTVLLANPRGFCAGVDRAIAIVERALDKFGPPVYVRHEVVHNRHVVEQLRQRGAVFVESLDEIPTAAQGAVLIFSAHGVSRALRAEAAARGFRVFDATCPLVTKVHVEVAKLHREGYSIVMIGHAGHPEVEGTMGQVEEGIYLVQDEADVDALAGSGAIRDPERVAYVTQTTLSIDDTARIIERLKARFPFIRGPRKDDICYATTNRQEAVKRLAAEVDAVIVVGSPTSSNANRLREVAQRAGVRAVLVEDASSIDAEWLRPARRVGVTAGASTPEQLVQGVVERLLALGFEAVEDNRGESENIEFRLPAALA
ncbi:MAG: 4-hydroxy-3-methylbut-2-enyl diphosphate reductase [Casimicrobiaceae bacterium]|nr:4-hydroxy-3-methylbut-2-enyl diphosphate reductase [Casimicrobiaceae bacterium]MCX8098001.1 4-hydroxy-3-methylbut-2-enyl diphosphate reductase [Casimicrobiaceae bacterium]MDW8311704.1 4-hydroxy-3-methylbut-2-enyl diphosphate reductase [Burkholderiales bacterium]